MRSTSIFLQRVNESRNRMKPRICITREKFKGQEWSGIFFFVVMALSACGGGTQPSEHIGDNLPALPEEVVGGELSVQPEVVVSSDLPVLVEKVVIRLDTCLNYSDDIDDHLPERIKKHADVSEFLQEYVAVGDEFYSNFYRNLKDLADGQMEVDEMEVVNKEGDDLIDMIKHTRNAYKSLKRTGTGVLRTAWSGKDLLVLEDRRKELGKKYSKKVLDSFTVAERAVDKYLYYSFVLPNKTEITRIQNHTSIRIIPSGYGEEVVKEFEFEDLLEHFIALQKRGNEVRKILVFNDLAGKRYCSGLVNQEIASLLNFWNSEEEEYKSRSKLFYDFSKELTKLKRELKEREETLMRNGEDWNEKSVGAFQVVLRRYEKAIRTEVENLNISRMAQPNWSIFKEAKKHAT